MPFQSRNIARALQSVLALAVVCTTLCYAQSAPANNDDTNPRMTPLVRAVAVARPAVVNLRGRKTMRQESTTTGAAQTVRQVNGMGTGVIIDPSGYILTNYHVVEGVQRIQVTLQDGTSTTGKLVAHDHKTDLALVKIRSVSDLPTIPLGTSTDVMLAETVAALGNAYGYEDTVTRGIVSEIGRTVQVSDQQVYHNLIQTDASINPGNSGGPLINLSGEMIGINVAVRVGAQGIAFAIPVNDAMDVAAKLLSEITQQKLHHGLVAKTVFHKHQPSVQIQSVADASAADIAGLEYGDIIKQVNGVDCHRAVDLHRQMLDKKPGDQLVVLLDRHGASKEVTLTLAQADKSHKDAVWTQLGIKLTPISDKQLQGVHPNYSRGLQILQVRPSSPADVEGIRPGDILVAMNGWKTESVDNLQYVLQQPDILQGNECVFYIIRNKEPFYGNISLPAK